MYKVLLNGYITKKNLTIPPNQSNREYKKYLKWLESGNKPEYELEISIEECKQKKYKEIDNILEQKYLQPIKYKNKSYIIDNFNLFISRCFFAFASKIGDLDNDLKGIFSWFNLSIKEITNIDGKKNKFDTNIDFLKFACEVMKTRAIYEHIAVNYKENVDKLSTKQDIEDFDISNWDV